MMIAFLKKKTILIMLTTEFKGTTSKLHPFIGKRREMNGTAFAAITGRNLPLFEAKI